METLLSICVGIGLSAACGFRVFVPLLVLSIAALSGHLTLAHGFEWIGSYPALVAFAFATCLEIAGYYIPWVDHLLDTVATPAAIIAGTLISASLVADVSPFLRWALAVIAGGGASAAGTAGLGNPLVATAELAGSLLTSIFAILAPVFVLLVLGIFLFLFGR